MSTLVVVVGEVALKVAAQSRIARHQGPGEGWPPALLEDGALDPLDCTVGLWPGSANEALLDAQLGGDILELEGAELGAIVGRDRFQLPAGLGQLPANSTEQSNGEVGAGIEMGAVDLSPDEGASHVDGGVLPDLALGAAQPPNVEAVELDQVAWLLSFEMK